MNVSTRNLRAFLKHIQRQLPEDDGLDGDKQAVGSMSSEDSAELSRWLIKYGYLGGRLLGGGDVPVIDDISPSGLNLMSQLEDATAVNRALRWLGERANKAIDESVEVAVHAITGQLMQPKG